MDWAPNRTRLLRLSNARTTPTAAPAKATSGNDLEPISSSCRISSRPSKGRLATARTTCHAKSPKSPNHSREPVSKFQTELRVKAMGDGAWSASGLMERSQTHSPPCGNFHFEIEDGCSNRPNGTKILRVRNTTLRIQMSVPKGTQTTRHLRVRCGLKSTEELKVRAGAKFDHWLTSPRVP